MNRPGSSGACVKYPSLEWLPYSFQWRELIITLKPRGTQQVQLIYKRTLHFTPVNAEPCLDLDLRKEEELPPPRCQRRSGRDHSP